MQPSQCFQQWGAPQTPQDLVKHNCLDCSLYHKQGYWRFQGPKGNIKIPISGTLRINDNDALAQTVLYGLGIALLPAYSVGMELQKGRIQTVLPEYLSVERHIYVCYLPNRHFPIKISTCVDFLSEYIEDMPY